MMFAQKLLTILDSSMTTPVPYGWFHLLSIALTAAIIAVLCIRCKNASSEQVRKTVLWTAVAVIILEVYKQINYTFTVTQTGIQADYQWYAFPWQFCSTPMYVGLLAGLTRKGKLHDSLCAYLATYAVFAGICVMASPGDIYVPTIGINIQTTICHCSMPIIGAYLFATGHVKLEHKTILKAIPVFAVMVGIAVVLNEVAYAVGIVPNETFNMFFVSRYCDPHLPVYSLVQAVVPYPWCLLLYIAGFSLAAYLVLLLAMAVHALAKKKTYAKIGT